MSSIFAYRSVFDRIIIPVWDIDFKALEKDERNIVEFTMDAGRVHLIIMVMIIPILLVFSGPFILIWDYKALVSGLILLVKYFIPVIFIGIAVHELLHGIGWSLFVENGFNSIKFGFNWKFLAPYCHCRKPLKARHYKIGTALPLLVMGILPSLFAIGSGNSSPLLFGIIFTWAAGGDIISLFMMRNLDNDCYVCDHPDKMGFYVKLNHE